MDDKQTPNEPLIWSFEVHTETLELQMIEVMHEALLKLSPEARQRVLRYLTDRVG